MSAYLKRLDIGNVGNVAEEEPTAYLKRVHIVEVVDENGNPWDPAPGPDPWDRVTVERAPLWDNGNVYDPEREIACQTAVFTGGIGEISYRFRWQYKAFASNQWVSTAWSGYLNTPEGDIYTIPKEAQNGVVRMDCEAIDLYETEGGDMDSYTVHSRSIEQSVSPLPPFRVISQGRIDQFIEPGGTYTAVPTIWEGGTDESTYRARWEWLPTPNSVWQLGEWQEYPNDALLAEVSFEVPINAGGGRIRIQSQARDPYVLGSNNTSNEVDINIGAIAVGNFTISGDPYPGETITANQPMVVGGRPPYTLLYDFGNGPQTDAVYEVRNEDMGRTITCMFTAYDTNFNSDSKQSTNGIGPITVEPSLSPVIFRVNSEIADVTDIIPLPHGTHVFQAEPASYPAGITWSWSVRGGNGTFGQDPIADDFATYITDESDNFPVIAVTIRAPGFDEVTINAQLHIQ